MTGLSFANLFGFGFREAAADACIVDRERAFRVSGQQQVRGPEENVIAAGAHRPEVVGCFAVTAGDEVSAATRPFARADAFFLPLIDVEQFVVVSDDERFGGLEESPLAIGGLVRNIHVSTSGPRVSQAASDRLQAGVAGGRNAGRTAGEASEAVLGLVVAVNLGEAFGFEAGEVRAGLEK